MTGSDRSEWVRIGDVLLRCRGFAFGVARDFLVARSRRGGAGKRDKDREFRAKTTATRVGAFLVVLRSPSDRKPK